MIGWLILAAVLIPALALGRWAERERRRDQARAQADPVPPAMASRPRIALRAARARLSAPGRPSGRTAARRSRSYAGR